MGAFSGCFPCLLACPSFINHFLTFWHRKVSQGHFGHSLTHPWSHSFPQGALFLLAKYRYLEHKIWALGVLNVTRVSLPLAVLAKKLGKCLCTMLEGTWLQFCSLGFKLLPNNISTTFQSVRKRNFILFAFLPISLPPLPGMCNPRNYSDTPPTSKSTVEELHEPIPSLFRALTEGDTQLNWNIVSFPVAEELSHHENLVSFLETVNQPHHQNVSVPSNNVHAPYSSDKGNCQGRLFLSRPPCFLCGLWSLF